MKKIMLFATILLFIPLGAAENELWFYTSENLLLDVDLSTGLDIVSSSPNPQIDFILANISFFPKERPGQKIVGLDFKPEPEFIDDVAVFRWENPPKQKLLIDMDSTVRVEDKPIRISEKIDFPLRNLPEEVMFYTEPAEIIDINDNIINLASEIASGKDDAVDVVDTIAVWVNTNIKYNLSTVTAEASQKASWVIINREGVCDELTSLFIAMVRSLGIPARFVAGISYTNSPDVPYNWGPHGWAEVYFPGYGWIPYDVTYGEYGWVDATHIVSHVSNDAGKVVSNYQWRAESGVSLNTEDLKTEVEILEIGSKKDPDISLKVDILKDEVGFGSYNLVTATVVNLRGYYVSKDIFISRTNNINLKDDLKKHILLRPGEVKQVNWIMQVAENLDRRYIYTFPVEVYTLKNTTERTEFNSVSDAAYYSLEEIKEISSSLEEKGEKAYSKNMEVECSTDKEEYYTYERPFVQCRIKNMGNIFLKDLNICLQDDCEKTHLGITQEKEMNFTVRRMAVGDNDLLFSISNEQISLAEHILFTILDEPKLDITDIEFPYEVRYNGKFTVQFRLKKESGSSAKDVKLTLSGEGINRPYSYPSVDSDIPYALELSGKDLKEGENIFNISVDYKDNNGKEYSASEEINISLVDVTFFQRIMLFFRGLVR